jgi:hypothetical protein
MRAFLRRRERPAVEPQTEDPALGQASELGLKVVLSSPIPPTTTSEGEDRIQSCKTEAAPSKDDTSEGDTSRKLIDALREFLKSEQVPKSNAPASVTLADAVWLLMAFASLLLIFLWVPEVWLKGEGVKFVLDKVAPWFLNLGAIAAILKSPDQVIAATRNTRFRWLVAAALLLLVCSAYPFITLRPKIYGDATAYVDGQRVQDMLSIAIRPHQVELRSSDSKIPTRNLRLAISDLLHAARHGISFRPDWRLVYPIQIDVRDEENLNICFEPDKFEFDQDFLAEAGSRFRRAGPKAVEYVSTASGSFEVQLPAGQYNVTGYRYGCGLTSLLPLKVGPGGVFQHGLGLARCASGTALPPAPCDQLLPKNSSGEK